MFAKSFVQFSFLAAIFCFTRCWAMDPPQAPSTAQVFYEIVALSAAQIGIEAEQNYFNNENLNDKKIIEYIIFNIFPDLLERTESQHIEFINKIINNVPEALKDNREFLQLFFQLQCFLMENVSEDRPATPPFSTSESASALRGPIKMSFGACSKGKNASLPSQNIPSPSGEDTFFIFRESDHSAAGVFDGVGGSLHPRYFVDRLAYNCEQVAHNKVLRAKDIIEQGFNKTCEERQAEIPSSAQKISGTTTALCMHINHETGMCDIANYGDSGLIIFRRSKIFFRTKEGHQGFNMPYALGWTQTNNTLFDQKHFSNDLIQLEPGDIIVMGSDGLFDNLWDSEINQAIQKNLLISNEQEDALAELISKILLELVEEKAQTNIKISYKLLHPFGVTTLNCVNDPVAFKAQCERFNASSEKMRRDFLMLCAVGSKKDDITVAVALVASQSEEKENCCSQPAKRAKLNSGEKRNISDS